MRKTSMGLRLSRRTVALLGGLLLLGAVAGGVAWATIPGGDGVIHGCYLKSGGTLRVIDASVTSCKKTETAIWWNQSGPPGEQGEPGEQGPPGPGAAFARLVDILGVGDSVQVPADGTPVHVLALDLPDGWGEYAESVVLATIGFANNGDRTGHIGCTLVSPRGGYVGMHFTLPGSGDPWDQYRLVSFEGAGRGGNTEVELSCSADPWGPPVGAPDIWVEQATLTAIPKS